MEDNVDEKDDGDKCDWTFVIDDESPVPATSLGHISLNCDGDVYLKGDLVR